MAWRVIVLLAACLAAGCQTNPSYVEVSGGNASDAESAPAPELNATTNAPALPDGVQTNPAAAPALAVAGATNPAAPPAVADAAGTGGSDYRILPQDIVKISVFDEPDITAEYQVAADGTINHPLLEKVQLQGLTLAGAEKLLTDSLARDYLVNPHVTATVVRSAGRRVFVFGQVQKPGAYSVPPDEPMTLLGVISLAGGFTDIAAPSRVRIIRRLQGHDTTLKIDAKAMIEGRSEQNDTPLEPGDVVTVPESIF